ncbi:hypothetical protein HK100_012594, partial [Physocladia obscura]
LSYIHYSFLLLLELVSTLPLMRLRLKRLSILLTKWPKLSKTKLPLRPVLPPLKKESSKKLLKPWKKTPMSKRLLL